MRKSLSSLSLMDEKLRINLRACELAADGRVNLIYFISPKHHEKMGRPAHRPLRTRKREQWIATPAKPDGAKPFKEALGRGEEGREGQPVMNVAGRQKTPI